MGWLWLPDCSMWFSSIGLTENIAKGSAQCLYSLLEWWENPGLEMNSGQISLNFFPFIFIEITFSYHKLAIWKCTVELFRQLHHWPPPPNDEICPSPPSEVPLTTTSPLAPLVYFLSPWICLFRTFHTNEIVSFVKAWTTEHVALEEVIDLFLVFFIIFLFLIPSL